MRNSIEVTYSIESGLSIAIIIPYKDIDKSLLSEFMEELQSLPNVVQRLKARGLVSDEDMLRDYLICRYGGSDNILDLLNGVTKSDYCHCGNRGHCPDEGFTGLCSQPPTVEDVKLSSTEIELLSLIGKDRSIKEIASIRNRSIHTIETQAKSIRAKLSAHSMACVLAKTSALGITNPFKV